MEAKSNETQVLSNAERQARFKANKVFKSLPLDVQRSIERLSDSPEEKARRTQAALDYQKKFPDNRHKGVTRPTEDLNATILPPDPVALPANFGQPDCECKHCRNNRANGSKHRINHGPYKTAGELADNELNRVTFPSDPDYKHEGICGCSACKPNDGRI